MASSAATNGTSTARPSSAANAQSVPSEFEIRRAELVSDIGESLEQVLQQINTLNRSLEGIIAIGNEFSSVEALWSQFENVMGREPGDVKGEGEQSQSQSGRQSRTEGNGDEDGEREARKSK